MAGGKKGKSNENPKKTRKTLPQRKMVGKEKEKGGKRC